MTAARLDCVPDGKKSPASVPKLSARTSWRRLTVGSSPKTSSPTSAFAIAWRMPGDGWVTVSERRSMVMRYEVKYEVRGVLAQGFVQLFQRGAAGAELALAELVQRRGDGVQRRM